MRFSGHLLLVAVALLGSMALLGGILSERGETRGTAATAKVSRVTSSQDTVWLLLGQNREDVHIDDVRLGDAVLYYDPGTFCVGVEEVHLGLGALLALKLPDVSIDLSGGAFNDNSVAAIHHFRAWYRSAYGESIERNDDGRTWNQHDQAALERALLDNYDEIMARVEDRRLKALLKFIRAEKRREAGSGEAASTLYHDILENFQDTRYAARARASIGFMKYRSKEYEASLAEYQKVLQDYAGSRPAQDALYFMGKNYHYLSRNAEAVDFFDRLIREHPQNKWAEGSAYFRAYARFVMTDYQAARKEFEDFTADYPKSVYADEAEYYAVKTTFLEGNYDQAVAQLAAYGQGHPAGRYADDAYFLLDLAHFYRGKEGHYAEAMEHFQEIIRSEKPDPERLFRAYSYSVRLADSQGADSVRSVLEREFKNDYPRKAIILREAATDDCAKAFAQYWLACYYSHFRLYERAIEEYQKMLESYECYHDRAEYSLTRTLESMGRYEEAIRGYEQIIVKYPQSEQAKSAMFGIGRIHMKAGRYDDASEVFEGMKRKYPNSRWAATIEIHLGLCYRQKGEIARAVQQYEKTLAQFPNNRLATRMAKRQLEGIRGLEGMKRD